jgi:ABC-2 type transport system permease protein
VKKESPRELGTLRRALAAYPTLLRVGLAEAVAYRAEMVVWMLTMTMPLVSLALWSAIAASGPVGRYGPTQFVAYFLATLVVRQLTGSWIVWELNQEIKSGTLARRLLKPIHPLIHFSASNLANVPLRAAISAPIAGAMLIFGAGSHFPHDPALLAILAASLVLSWVINFFTMAIIGSLAFYIESSTSVFEVWLMGFMVLSGYLIPLELLPGAARTIAYALPFRYTLAFPVEIAIGMLDRQAALHQLFVQTLFATGTGGFSIWFFSRGLKRFQAFGN